MVPSGIKRDSGAPFRTRKLDNGTVVVEDAYEGLYTYAAKRSVGTEIKGLRIETPDSKKAARRTSEGCALGVGEQIEKLL